MLKLVSALVLAMSGVMSSASTSAAGLQFECDTPAGRYSTVEIPIATFGVEVKGELLVNAVRPSTDWAPEANVLIHSGQLDRAVGLRAFLYKGEESRLSLNMQGQDRDTYKEIDLQNWEGRVFQFKLTFTKNGHTILESGEGRAEMITDFSEVSALTLLCSSGDFSFRNVTVTATR